MFNKVFFLFLLLSLNGSYASSFRIPANLEELASGSELIVVGKISKIIGSYTFYGYDNEAPVLPFLDQNTPIKIGLPTTDYLIKVDRLIKPSKQKDKTKQLVLRMVGQNVLEIDKLNQEITARPDIVKKQLFFLNANPDGTYGASTIASIMLFKTMKDLPDEHLIYQVEGEDRVLSGTQLNAESTLTKIEQLIVK